MEKAKAIGLFRLKINAILEMFRGYGYDVYIPETAQAITDAALVLVARLQDDKGEDHA